MRLTRLVLERYGHLSDTALDFPDSHGLHVVLGPNEAGKSTALAAIGDCLFGFGHSTDFDHLHGARSLRVAVTLRAGDGRVGSFVRRKGRRGGDLSDQAGAQLPESAIQAFLAGATRDRFDKVFGLDAKEFRTGGQKILAGEGDVGESILQAQTGLHGFRALEARLDKQASALFGDRRGERALHSAADRFKLARTALSERSVQPADYQRAIDERDALEETEQDEAQEARTKRTQRAVLDRIRRTAPARAALLRAEDDLRALGPAPILPDDAALQCQQAVLSREKIAHSIDLEQTRADDIQQRLASLTIDAALLAEGEAIDRLAAERDGIAKAERDHPDQVAVATQRRGDMEKAARQLGLDAPAEALAGRVPDALTRAAVGRAVTDHAAVEQRLDTARHSRAEAEEQLTAANTEHDALPPAADAAELRAAIDAAKEEGRIDDDRAKAAATRRQAEADLADGLAALPLWDGSAGMLAAATVPLDATVAMFATRLAETEKIVGQHRDTRTAHDVALLAIQAELAGMAARGELATAEAIADARALRDKVWTLIRRLHIDGGAPPSAGELAAVDAGDDLAGRFETLLRGADTLADRRADDVERVVALDQLRARQAETRALRDVAATAEAQAHEAHDSTWAEWQEAWRPAGIVASDPAAMREWLARRKQTLDLKKLYDDACANEQNLAQRHATAFAALAALLPPEAQAGDGRLTTKLRAAERSANERETGQKALATAAAAVKAAQDAVAKAQREQDAAEQALTKWRDTWAKTIAPLGLAADAPAADGQLALDLWQTIKTEAEHWNSARTRVSDMTRAIDTFAADSEQAARRAGIDLIDLPAQDRVRQLASRLAAARDAEKEHKRLTEELNSILEAIKTLRRQSEQAEATLAALRALAGADDDDGLQQAIERAAAHAGLRKEIEVRITELHSQDDGLSRSELDTEAAGHDMNALPDAIAALDARLAEIGTARTDRALRLATLQAALDGMEYGNDAAAAAQEMRDARAEMDEAAARYVRLRLAQTLLRAGIERVRAQSQGPLLRRAGDLFAALTEGRYHRLAAAEADGDTLVLKAQRPDGIACPVGRLSEGARDQLYLALRLAAIEEAARGAEPLPLIADDLLAGFDDRRARAALRVLADFGRTTQTILFTHHAHIAAMATPDLASMHTLGATLPA